MFYNIGPWWLFQPSLMFVGKAKARPLSEALEMGFTRVSSSLTRKHQTWLERPTRIGHQAFLGPFVVTNIRLGLKACQEPTFTHIGPTCKIRRK
jgi:hypothetical protein